MPTSIGHLSLSLILILEREYINFLGQNDFVSAVRKKNDWADHILRFSSQNYEKSVAKHYQSVIEYKDIVKLAVQRLKDQIELQVIDDEFDLLDKKYVHRLV